MKNKAKTEIIELLKGFGKTATGEVRTDKHVSKSPGRRCHKCNQKINYGEECYTQTYKLENTRQKFQASFHINCL
jgi:hypothetical protein